MHTQTARAPSSSQPQTKFTKPTHHHHRALPNLPQPIQPAHFKNPNQIHKNIQAPANKTHPSNQNLPKSPIHQYHPKPTNRALPAIINHQAVNFSSPPSPHLPCCPCIKRKIAEEKKKINEEERRDSAQNPAIQSTHARRRRCSTHHNPQGAAASKPETQQIGK
ncbi:hypothetical protein M0R45_002177 [Rubus argutus]|uniref:Uncharacterized protein n=1 Tax=Rubus argutus TaxID=59490 RepID=A0AAW1VRQ2_RUBAR